MLREFFKEKQIMLGLFGGYFLVAIIHAMFTDISLREAMSDEKLIFMVAGIGLAMYLFYRTRKSKE